MDRVTLEAWIYIDPTLPTSHKNIVRKGHLGDRCYGLDIGVPSTRMMRGWVNLGSAGGSGALIASGSTSLTTGVWHHVAMTYDGSQVRVYVNGVQDGISGTTAGNIFDNNLSVRIGGQPSGDNGGAIAFKGRIDEVKIFNRALTEIEIGAIVSAGSAGMCKTYSLTYTAGPGGTIDGSATQTVDYNTNGTLVTATPNPGYHFVNWSDDVLTASRTDVNVTGDITVNANFAINTYTITASAGDNGSISPSGAVSVNHDGSQTFTITANPNYHIADVLVDGNSVGAVASYEFTNVTANRTISATFAIDTYTITATAGANGSIDPSGAVSVNHDGSQTFTITANLNYHIADVLVDGNSVGAVASYEFTNVTANHTIEAIFSPNPGIISGTVRVGTSGLANVAVKLLDADGAILKYSTTNSLGEYSFSNEPSNIDYQVFIVEPLGYTVGSNSVAITLPAGGTCTVDFVLTKAAISGNARGVGYWKHQFDEHRPCEGYGEYERKNGHWKHRSHQHKCRGHHWDETIARLNGYIAAVHQYYTPHFNVFANLTSIDDWGDMLSLRHHPTMLDKAKKQLAALVMNFVSLKIGQWTVVTKDTPGRTAGDVLTYVSELVMSGDASKYALARDLAKQVNDGDKIKKGIVPVGSILYKGGAGHINWTFDVPEEYALAQNYPNPFNPTTTLQFDLPEISNVSVIVYNILGRQVAELVNGEVEAGRFQHTFDGSQMASGVYFIKINAASLISERKLSDLKKMILMK